MLPSVEQITSVLRIVLPWLLLFAVQKGWLTPEQSSGLVDNIVNFLPGFLVFVTSVWALFAHTQKALVTKISTIPDVSVVVGPTAPATVKAVAADPAVPDVVAAK